MDNWDRGNLVAANYISFTDDEIPPEGTGHTKAIHISARCKGCTISRILVDNGSSLNVMPKSTLNQMLIENSHIRPSPMIVRAFDGTIREVIGSIELPMEIGPVTFTFNVKSDGYHSLIQFSAR